MPRASEIVLVDERSLVGVVVIVGFGHAEEFDECASVEHFLSVRVGDVLPERKLEELRDLRIVVGLAAVDKSEVARGLTWVGANSKTFANRPNSQEPPLPALCMSQLRVPSFECIDAPKRYRARCDL